MKYAFDTALALCKVEEACLEMKGALCNGSFLKGHTAKPLADIDQEAVRTRLATLKAAVTELETKVNE